MKKALFFIFFTASFLAHASFLGGEITWKNMGNGEFVFTLTQYRSCYNATSVPQQANIQRNGGTPIACTLVDSAFVSMDCGSAVNGITCADSLVFSPVKKYVYQSAPVFLSASVSAGYEFYYRHASRASMDNLDTAKGFTIRAKIYQAGVQQMDDSPQFEDVPRYAFATGKNRFGLDGIDPNMEDSLYFSWAPAWNDSTAFPPSAVAYDTGYTFMQPLPSTAYSPQNVPPVMSRNGNVQFTNFTEGRYAICYKIESWRNGQKLGEVFRDLEWQIFQDKIFTGSCFQANNVPEIEFTTYPGYGSLNALVSVNDTIGYEIEVLAGDTIQFDFTGTDYDLTPNCGLQNVTGSFVAANCPNGDCAQISTLNANGTFTNVQSSAARFYWETQPKHGSVSGKSRYRFLVQMQDDNCTLPGTNSTVVEVIINRPIELAADTINICQGDTATLQVLGDTTNLSWTPSNDISCTNCAQPMFFPASSTLFTVSDNNTGYAESVFVKVDAPAPKPIIAPGSVGLLVQNWQDFDTVVYYRNGAPFYPAFSGSSPSYLTGKYWVEGIKGACSALSDTMPVVNNANMNANTANGGTLEDAKHQLATYGATFKLTDAPFYDIKGFYVHAFANNAQNDLQNLELKIYDGSPTNIIYSSDSATRVESDLIYFHGSAQLPADKNLLIGIYLDTNVSAPLYRPNSWPILANNGRVQIINATEKLGNTYPNVSADRYPYFHFDLASAISVAEESLENVKVFPNPAKSQINIVVDEETTFELYTMQGTLVHRDIAKNGLNKVDVSALASGIYILTLQNEKGASAVRRIVIQ